MPGGDDAHLILGYDLLPGRRLLSLENASQGTQDAQGKLHALYSCKS